MKAVRLRIVRRDAARRSAEIIERTIDQVSQGVEFVTVARESFKQVSNMIETGSQAVSEIAAHSQTPAKGVAVIGQAIARMGR